MFTLAIETGGTKLQMVLGTSEGKILFHHRQKVRPELGHTGTLAAIEGAMPLLREKARELGGEISRIGLGFGGIVNTTEGVLVASEQISGWNGFNLEQYLTEKTGIPARVYNDSNAATWGEYVLGSGKKSSVFMYTNIGSGIGGGIVINGKLFNGQGLGAMEIGQTFAYDPDDQSGHPFIQLERLCSGWGIERRLRSADIPQDSLLWALCQGVQENLTGVMLGDAVKAEDAFATAFFDKTLHIYSLALANAINLFAPEVVAIGGGISLIGEPLFDRIRRFVAPYVANNVKGRYEIVPCQLGEEIVVIGALLLAGRDDQI